MTLAKRQRENPTSGVDKTSIRELYERVVAEIPREATSLTEAPPPSEAQAKGEPTGDSPAS